MPLVRVWPLGHIHMMLFKDDLQTLLCQRFKNLQQLNKQTIQTMLSKVPKIQTLNSQFEIGLNKSHSIKNWIFVFYQRGDIINAKTLFSE
jgi:hypothetical protein